MTVEDWGPGARWGGLPVRLVRVVDAPVVPHTDVRGAGVVTHVTLVHFWHAAF